MKKLIITFLAFIICLFATAQNDTISVIGIVDNIESINKKNASQCFEIKVKTLGIISGKIDSIIIFYVDSPANNLLITDYQKEDTYKEKIYYFILKTNIDSIIFVDALSPNVLEGKCPKCSKQLQGFRFLGDSFAHFIYYCPIHGKIDEEWEHYD